MEVSRHVGERLLVAAEEGLRGGAYTRRGQTTASTAFWLILIKFAFATALMIALVIGVSRAITGIITDVAQRQTQKVAPIPPAAPSQPVGANAGQLRRAEYGPAEIIPGQTPGPTPAEIREQQRRADEAARIIAPTTPEM